MQPGRGHALFPIPLCPTSPHRTLASPRPALPRPGRVFLHPSSLNFTCGKLESGWAVYSEVVETSKVFVRESSMVPIYAILLFGGAHSPGLA